MRTRIRGVGRVRMLYKHEAVKVVPVDEAHSAGIKPSGEEGWRERLIKEEKERGLDGGAYPWVLIPKFSTIERGRRLTQARIRQLNIGEHPTTNERDLLLEMLFNREAAIAFTRRRKDDSTTSSSHLTCSPRCHTRLGRLGVCEYPRRCTKQACD